MVKRAVFIDGSNLHGSVGRVTRIFRETNKLKTDEYFNIDFKKLLDFFKKDDHDLVKLYYATSVTDSELVKKKDFFNTLNYLGYKLEIKRRKDQGKEKGIDMAIAMEMLICAYNGFYDEAILVADDGDYCQLIREVQRVGKKVGIASFGLDYGLNNYLLNEKDFYVDLLKSDILIEHKSKPKI